MRFTEKPFQADQPALKQQAVSGNWNQAGGPESARNGRPASLFAFASLGAPGAQSEARFWRELSLPSVFFAGLGQRSRSSYEIADTHNTSRRALFIGAAGNVFMVRG